MEAALSTSFSIVNQVWPILSIGFSNVAKFFKMETGGDKEGGGGGRREGGSKGGVEVSGQGVPLLSRL